MTHQSGFSGPRGTLLATVLSVSVVLAWPRTAPAQVIWDPSLHGQWAGPLDLDGQINDHSDQFVPPGMTLVPWGEIAHAATLPPPNDGYVLFWCERETPCGPTLYPNPYFIPYETFLWHPRTPGNLAAVFPVPTPGENGLLALFCGGHSFTRDGRPISVGGQNHALTCQAAPISTGTTGVFLFDNVAFDGVAPEPAWHRLLPGMQRARWYPTLTRDHAGKHSIWGHQFAPEGSGPATWFTRERFDIPDGVVGIVWDPIETPVDLAFENYTSTYPLTSCVGGTPLIGMRGYPRVEPILDQSLVDKKADMAVLSAFTDIPPTFGPVSSYFLDLDACTSASEVERWFPGTAGPPPIAFTVAHYFDMTGATPKEVIYAIGGDIPANPGGDPTAPDDCLTFTNRVVKLVDPSPSSLWKGAADGVPQLKYSRKHMQAAIGLDGATYVFGGEGREDLGGGSWGPCLYVRNVERYRPPEIFATPSSQWKLMAAQAHDRGHHSVAGAMADGRMYSAGGDHDEGAGEPPSAGERSVEIYSPEYLFQGFRPVIRNISNREPTFGSTITLDVEISGSATNEFRVALVSPGTMTHGYNFSQRYIKLKLANPPPPFNPPPATTAIQVQIPGDGHVVPPGYYLITVVRQNGVPSVGEWIRVKAS